MNLKKYFYSEILGCVFLCFWRERERAWQIYGNVRLKASGTQQTDQLAFSFSKEKYDRKNPF